MRLKCAKKGCELYADVRTRDKLCKKHYQELKAENPDAVAGSHGKISHARQAERDKVAKKIKAESDKKQPQNKTATKTKGPQNVEELKRFVKWLAELDPDAPQKFGTQIALAETLAGAVDQYDPESIREYRQHLTKIHERVDKIYGNRNIDVVSLVSKAIENTARKAAKKGWD